MPFEVAFVTANQKKWEEVQEILGSQVKVRQVKLDLPEIQGSVEEIALLKCKEAAKAVDGPVFVEDTSLYIDAWNGLPGPYIRWFLESVGIEGINDMLDKFPVKTAKAVCILAYSDGPNSEPLLFQGVSLGTIVRPRGPKDFGWNPIFQPDDQSPGQTLCQTYAEMPFENRRTIYFRAKALQKLSEYFSNKQQN